MLKELVKKNRSARSFSPKRAISPEILCELCDIARHSPAAMNLQPLKYRIVTDPDEVAALVANTGWARSLSIPLPPKGHEPSAFIVICHDLSITPEKPIFLIDVGIVAETIMLAATEKGLGGCMIGSGKEETIASLLDLPEGIVPKLVLALGVPDEKIVLEDAREGRVTYYRDGENIHHVPKRPLEEILLFQKQS